MLTRAKQSCWDTTKVNVIFVTLSDHWKSIAKQKHCKKHNAFDLIALTSVWWALSSSFLWIYPFVQKSISLKTLLFYYFHCYLLEFNWVELSWVELSWVRFIQKSTKVLSENSILILFYLFNFICIKICQDNSSGSMLNFFKCSVLFWIGM